MTTTTPNVQQQPTKRTPSQVLLNLFDRAIAWLRKNLFSSIWNSIITIVTVLVLLVVGFFLLRWVFTRDYEIIRYALRIFMIGQFPDDQLWRLWIAGYLFALAVGFFGGSLARDNYQAALDSEIEAKPDSLLNLLRRFWVLIALMVFFSAFASTVMPFILVVTVVAVFAVGRVLGWRSPRVIRRQAIYITAILALAAMMAIAGTSGLGGFCVGLVLMLWVRSLIATQLRSAGQTGRVASLMPLAVGALIGIVAWFVISRIGFEGHGWKEWGGLMVNVFAAVIGITLGLPLGILLALGRRSELPIIKSSSILFIEFVRGVPLISLLLFATTFLPLFLPTHWETPVPLTLAVIVIMFFSAAYIAEIVRGGLQAVAKGQTEAGQALGLSPSVVQRSIVLPQALRAVIPAMVGQFISLFKDTSLLFVAGVPEFLEAAGIANVQQQFLGKGLAPVTYLFVAIGFWAFAYSMSKESRRLERRLGVGSKSNAGGDT